MKRNRNDVMEIVGLALAVLGFVALLYGLSVLADWLAWIFGGGIAFLIGATLVTRANQAAKGGDA